MYVCMYVTQPWKRFGYPVSMSIDFEDFSSPLLSFCFEWEDISNTWDIVSWDIQTPQISSKILHCTSYFQRSSRCLDILMKHCLLCLIYYIKPSWVKFYEGDGNNGVFVWDFRSEEWLVTKLPLYFKFLWLTRQCKSTEAFQIFY